MSGENQPPAEGARVEALLRSGLRLLDLGCGNDKETGALGVDLDPTSDADLPWDLNQTPYPLPESHFERIRLQDVLEHLDDIPAVMREIWRLCAPGGIVDIRTPHYTSHYAYADPTHRHYYSLFSLDFFIEGGVHFRPAWGSRFALVERRVDVGRIHRCLGMKRLAERFPEKYEKYFAHLCPILNMSFRLRAIKE